MIQGEQNKTLSEIVQTSNALTQILIECGGELTPELELILSAVEQGMAEKLDSYDMVMSRLDYEADFFSLKAAELSSIAKGCEKVKNRLRERIKNAMIELGHKELHGETVRFILSPTKPKLVINEADLAEKYKTPVVTMEINKTVLIDDLNNGEIIPGARLEGGLALRRYAKGGSK